MHSTIQQRIDALQHRLELLNLVPLTRADLIQAVREIAIEQDKITRRDCAEIVRDFARNGRFIECERQALSLAKDAILNSRALCSQF